MYIACMAVRSRMTIEPRIPMMPARVGFSPTRQELLRAVGFVI